ncbi:hypothetical protein SUGI_0360740 [Cryptomeria japonica]|nr:hypothetical protein SUGI_0360740 [Cryptomeria japonica]
MAHSQRNFSTRNKIHWTKCHRVRQPSLHIRHCIGIPVNALSFQIRDFFIFHWLGFNHVYIRPMSPSGNKECANRRNDRESVETTLAMEEVCHRL